MRTAWSSSPACCTARTVRDYLVITFAYWVFTLTDGALRMLVLLHLHEQGYTPLTLAGLFLLYEFFGVTTNFTAGWIGARFGLKSTLWSGLSLQIVATSVLASQADALTVALVVAMQGLSGIAKDLTKMSAKSYVRLLAPREDRLLHWVAILTGSKNALKGAGFFLGGLLLTTLGFRDANLAMASGLALALLVSWIALPTAMGKRQQAPRWRDLWGAEPRVQQLSWARLFLFGSRDAWFAIGLPVFLVEGLDWGHAQVGAFLALWVIGYGFVQASAPKLMGLARRPDARALVGWTGILIAPVLVLAGLLLMDLPIEWLALSLIGGLGVFGLFFATNSALHSFLILSYSEEDEVALRVGFYYMANAAGRFSGTLASGLAYQLGGGGASGLAVCLFVSAGFLIMSTWSTRGLARMEAARTEA